MTNHDFRAIIPFVWGISAVGSAPHWQCGGHGFKSRMLHWYKLCICRAYLFVCDVSCDNIFLRDGSAGRFSHLTRLHHCSIIYLTRQPEGERHHPTWQNIKLCYKNSRPNFTREQDGYFLYVYVKIATMSKEVVSIICNSSYVLIIITLPVRLRSDESTSPGCPAKYIVLIVYMI